MSEIKSLQDTINLLVQKGKGILAVDESHPTMAKRFQSIGVESNPETRGAYRNFVLSTPSLRDFISGVILFEETLTQSNSDNIPIPKMLTAQGIVPGIKVDKGKQALANADGDEITQGLHNLNERLIEYRSLGARFAKWRNVYHISAFTPSPLAIEANAEMLARYAAICQKKALVPTD